MDISWNKIRFLNLQKYYRTALLLKHLRISMFSFQEPFLNWENVTFSVRQNHCERLQDQNPECHNERRNSDCSLVWFSGQLIFIWMVDLHLLLCIQTPKSNSPQNHKQRGTSNTDWLSSRTHLRLRYWLQDLHITGRSWYWELTNKPLHSQLKKAKIPFLGTLVLKINILRFGSFCMCVSQSFLERTEAK